VPDENMINAQYQIDQPSHFFCYYLSKNINHSLAQLQCMLNHGHNTPAPTPRMQNSNRHARSRILSAPPAPHHRTPMYKPSGDGPSTADMILPRSATHHTT